MEPAKQVLVRFTKAPSGHVRLKEEMRDALIGVMIKTIPNPNCFITNTDDLLEAIEAQCPIAVYAYWKEVLEDGPKRIYLGRSECEVINLFRLQLVVLMLICW